MLVTDYTNKIMFLSFSLSPLHSRNYGYTDKLIHGYFILYNPLTVPPEKNHSHVGGWVWGGGGGVNRVTVSNLHFYSLFILPLFVSVSLIYLLAMSVLPFSHSAVSCRDFSLPTLDEVLDSSSQDLHDEIYQLTKKQVLLSFLKILIT